MSAKPPVPKGHAFLAFELHPQEGMRYLCGVPHDPARQKVRLAAKAQALRRTRGRHRLAIWCVPCAPTHAAMRETADMMLEVWKRNHPPIGPGSIKLELIERPSVVELVGVSIVADDAPATIEAFTPTRVITTLSGDNQ